MSLRNRFLDPAMVRRLGRLEMKARQVVEGFLTGLHNSPYRGFSVEFAEHRSYVPGDDIRHIDWRVYARRERYYIKQYHEETNFVATVLVDGSESMTFASGKASKLEYACTAAMAISYLVLRQNDAAALGLFDERTAGYLQPGTSVPFLARLSQVMEQLEPTGKTNVGKSLEQFSRLVSKRGIVVVISDFLDEPASVLEGLRKLKFRGHEVIVLHVLDPHEIDFPMRGHIRFEGIEKQMRVFVEPHRIRDAYLAALQNHVDALRQGCSRSGIDYRLASTGEALDGLLMSYLSSRVKRRRVAR
jgi:uncharacterized protein (DUF58 family)